MRVVAVVQLDRDEKTGFGVLPTRLFEQLGLLSQCKSIDKLVFTASASFAAHLPKHLLQEYTVRIIDEWSSDPLTNFYQVAQKNLGEINHRSENPLILRLMLNSTSPDPAAIDAMVENHLQQRHHYSRNQQFDEKVSASLIEIMNYEVLDEACREALLPDDRLHITPYIYRQQERLSVGFYSPANETLLSA